MKLEIREKNSTIELGLEPLTQLCGTNFAKKNFLIQSLVKHFSSYKYKDYEDALINNVLWNGEVIGRKYFSVIHIVNRESLLKAMSVTRLSVFFDYLSLTIAKLDCQESMGQLEDTLDRILEKLNAAMQEDDIGLEMSLEENTLIELVQNGVVKGQSGRELETLDNEELLDDFLHMLEVLQRSNPKRQLIIFEDIDHMVDLQYYEKFCALVNDMGEKQGLFFVVTTSIKKYVALSRKLLPGIVVVNDEVFSFPEWEHLCDFMERNYPCQFKISEEECYRNLKNIVQEIGWVKNEINIQSSVMLKMFNQVIGTDIGKAVFINDLERNYILK